MCGIVGMAGEIKPEHERAFTQLLLIDSLRGMDSTGVVVACDDEVYVHKNVGNAYELTDTRKYSQLLVKNNKIAVIGHNRSATTGSIKKANSHPFEFDQIVGVHNGTLTNKCALEKGHSFEVDSEAFLYHIQEKGIKSAVDTARGAWALVWWDKVAKSLNFKRNKERPLYITTTKAGKVLFFASEKWMIEGVLWRNNIQHNDVLMISEDTHITYFFSNTGTFLASEVTKYPPYVPPQVSYTPPPNNYQPPSQKPITLDWEKVSGEFDDEITYDKTGKAGFISFFPSSPADHRDIRMYVRDDINIFDYLGMFAEVEVSRYAFTAAVGTWHRINPNTVTSIDMSPVGAPPTDKYLCDCSWCSSPIHEGTAYKKFTEYILCEECAKDEETVNLCK